MWLLVGSLYALSIVGAFTIGIFVLPIAVAATLLLVRHHADGSAAGLLSGAGLPLLYIAYLNRDGPGTVCSSTAGGSSCTDEWSPWPWILVAVVLVAAGVLVFIRLRSSQRALETGPALD
jgi:hypothetical protein